MILRRFHSTLESPPCASYLACRSNLDIHEAKTIYHIHRVCFGGAVHDLQRRTAVRSVCLPNDGGRAMHVHMLSADL